MHDHETIIDLKFGLSQLSGNQDLLVKLLSKFHAQYVDLADKLDQLIINDDVIAANNIIHTLKGVSGNLGLNALHTAAKNLESTLTTESHRHSALLDFNSVLSKTLSEIATLSQDTSPNEPLQKSPLNQLNDALRNNEYISADKLVGYLSDNNLTESKIYQITQAIEELDYSKALRLLGAN